MADLHDPSPYHERYQQLVGAELSPRRAEMHRLADAIRVAIDCLIHTRASDSDIAGAADLAEALATMLRAQPRGRSVDGWAEVANAGDAFGFFDYSPVFGRANPLAPPVEMEVHDSEVRGRARWGAAYEGPPGCVHGGHIAAAFDEVLGMTQSIAGAPGMTGILTIRYRNPTPLHTDLTFVARVARVDGRKIYTEGTLLNDDVVCAEGEALFISVDFGRFEAMRAQANEAQVNDDTRSSTSSP